MSQAPTAPHTQYVDDVCGADPSVMSHTGPVTWPEPKAVLLVWHWLSGA